ncbi:MAG: glutamate--tRNA ligase [bacterium]|nr:glutamate--tRNA ligase [bacterium]
MEEIRTRFAPSPTGPLHMGSVRTALFNYLFAKKNKGTFLLRIEDTDKERSESRWEEDILSNLTWLKLLWDEKETRQSDRTDIYEKHLRSLLEQGKAYYCFCSPEELEAQRQSLVSNGKTPKYIGTCRSLLAQEQEKRIQRGDRAVIRFIVEEKHLHFDDLVRGRIEFDTALLGDIVIAKDLRTPLYNFTVVVDDHDTRITHVIRGEDHIPNTPKQILLQEALGLPRVFYAHLPLILAEDRTKLSKRHGDNSVTRFRKEGYLPETIINFLALLGWNPGDDREIFSLQELEQEFSLQNIQKGGAIFNMQRFDWFNSLYIRKMSLAELTEACLPHLQEAGLISNSSEETKQYASKAVALYQERLQKLSEISSLVDFFFMETLSYSKDLLTWKDATEDTTQSALQKSLALLSALLESSWDKEKISATLLPEAEKEKNRGYLLWPLRVALTGKKASAGPFEVAVALGKEKSLSRIQEAITMVTQSRGV